MLGSLGAPGVCAAAGLLIGLACGFCTEGEGRRREWL